MKGTGRRLAALLLALLMLLPVRALATGTDAAGGTAETAETADPAATAAAEETAGTDYADVSALLAACTDHQLSSRTALVDALHEVVLAQMNLSIQQDALEQAQGQLAELEEQYLMGLVQQADLDSAQDAVDDAQGQVDTAQLEQLKLVSRVRSLTGQDISGQSYNAQDFFLTLMPAEITLESLQDAIVAYGMAEDVQQAVQDIEQDYIDITITYSEVASAAEDYADATAAREEAAQAVIMGNATDADFAQATQEMRQARLAVFTAISDYSRLLYRINETCGGALSDQAGLLTEYLGTES